MANLFAASAAALLGEDAAAATDPDVRRLLQALDYSTTQQPGAGGPAATTRHRARLLQAASRFVRLFQLAAPDAPGLVSFGAELDPAVADPMHAGSPTVSVSGVGVTPQEAFQGCVGEGIEYLSQLQVSQDVLQPPPPGDPTGGLGWRAREFLTALSACRLRGDADLTQYRAARLPGRQEILLPADLCLRRPPGRREIKPPFPLSAGSAAGTSWAAAAVHGVLELIERDAASLWWRGGHRAGAIPPDHEAQLLVDELLPRLRQGNRGRRSWLLDITTDIGIACVAAVSCGQDGYGLAFGLAARPSLKAAARSAVLEMCQIELAHAVVEAKCRERGEAALNQQDWVHRRRATGINVDRCRLLHPGARRDQHPLTEVTDSDAVLSLILDRLARFGIESFGLDLTRQCFAVPVARVIAPGLQLEPSEIVGSRLADMIARTGGGAVYTDGIALV